MACLLNGRMCGTSEMRIDYLESYDMANFETAIQQILIEEGGYVNDPDDPGGETKYGITKRTFPELDIFNLTAEQARDIYRREYWDRFGLDQIEDDRVAERLFSFIVNMGSIPAIKCFQRALRACGHFVNEDGRLGPETISAARRADRQALLAALKCEAAGMYRYFVAKSPDKQKYLKGWLSRAYC